MTYLKAFWASWCWAVDQSRRAQFEQAVFGRVDPGTVKDIDKYLKSRGVLW